jgi:hypothetical protein
MEKNKKLEIRAENALNAYNNTDANGRELLEHLFGKELFEPKNIMERVKTYEDACTVLDLSPILALDDLCICSQHQDGHFSFRGGLDVTAKAYLKLCIIAAALNEGWQPKFTEDEYRWYPYFYLYTKEQYDRLDEDEKKDCRVVGLARSSAYVTGGVVYAFARYAWSLSSTYYGSRLAFKSEELAEYCGKQFIDIWMEYLIG